MVWSDWTLEWGLSFNLIQFSFKLFILFSMWIGSYKFRLNTPNVSSTKLNFSYKVPLKVNLHGCIAATQVWQIRGLYDVVSYLISRTKRLEKLNANMCRFFRHDTQSRTRQSENGNSPHTRIRAGKFKVFFFLNRISRTTSFETGLPYFWMCNFERISHSTWQIGGIC